MCPGRPAEAEVNNSELLSLLHTGLRLVEPVIWLPLESVLTRVVMPEVRSLTKISH